MIDSLEPGDPLPEQPPGPFGSSDVATMRELTQYPNFLIASPFTWCLRHFSDPQTPDPLMGWTQAGGWSFPLQIEFASEIYFLRCGSLEKLAD